MPHSSRARKTRRNRNKRVKYRQVNTRSDDYSQQPNTNEKNNDSCEIKCDQHPLLETVTKDPEAEKVNESTKEVESIDESISRTIREVAGNLVEAKVNSHAVKVASEVEPLSSTTIRSISGNHVSTRNKQKLERRLVNSEVKICEISSVSGSPLTASIGHMTGVGILQTKLINQEHQHDSIVTISEPVEPLKPLPTDVVLRVETLGKSTALGFSPASEKINKDGPEIHEVTDSDVETTEFCKPSLVVEVDNERESAEHEIKDAILEETSTDNSVDEGNEESICEEDNNEENSVEIASNELSNDEITMQNNDQMIEDGLIKMCGDGGGTKNMIKVKNDKIKDIVKNENFQSREVLLDKKNVSKPLTFIDERRDLQDFEENNLLNNPNIRENEEKSNDNILQCKSKSKSILNNYFSSAGERFLDIIHEESERLSGDEEQHIRDFINGEIAKFRREKRSLNERREEREEEEEEEEKDEKERTIEVSTSRSEDLQVLHETEKNFLVNENAKLQGEISNNTEKKLISNNGKFYSSNSFESFELKSKEKKILDLADNARQVPEPPRRSSSFINKDVVEPIRPPTPLQVDDSPPPLPSPPSLSQYTCLTPFNRVNQFAEDKSGDKPKNPSLPSFLSSSNYTADTPLNLGITHEIELKREEGDRESIKRGTQDLCNNTDESNKIGNDDVDETSRLEIAHDHVDLSATMSWKISDAGHLSACESPRELSSSLKSAAATTVEYRRETKNQDEVESSRPFQVPKVVAEKQKVIGKSLLETRKLECAYKKKYEQNPKNPSFKVENEIKEFPERRELGSSEVLKVVESENIEKLQEKYIDNNLCHEKFLETVEQKIDKCHEEKIINVSLDREVKVKNNNESELNESQEVADNLERCKNSVESVSTDFSLKNIDERGQESSSSAASPSTVRYVPEDTCDIDLVEADVADEESLPKLKLKLSENLNNISETSSSPQPIPYSPVEELYYVPLNENDLVGIEKKNSDIKPSLLKDLCIKKILSMPYGAQIIREITLPKFNIFQNLKTIQKTLENFQSTSEEEVNSSNEMMKKRPKSWMGVPTNQDPQLLVCFSPSQQQENCVRTSADKLLDLHKKFLNRRSYHEQVGVDGRCEIKVPKYRVEVNSTKESQDLEKSERNEWNQSNRVTATSSASSSNRLLEIIKENPIAADDSLPKVTETHKNVRQDRLKTTRLADWLTLARSESPSAGYSKCEKISSSHLSTERRRYGNEVHQNNPLSPIKHPDTLMTDNKATNKCIFNDRSGSSGRGLNDTSHRINSALIIQSPECPNERQNATPLNKTPITQKSAIIDKSSSTPEQRKWRPQPLRGSIDSRHVNPALINDKPETPPRCRRSVTVDRSCIDNTSIFDKAPPKNYLEPRGYGNPEALKQVTAKEIVENLKRLKVQGKDVKDQIDVQRRHSLPPEIFDRQLEYIERLEDQLKEVILAEEEEEKAFKEFHDQVKAEIVLNENKNHSSVSENDDDSREIWHEESRLEDGDHIKYFKKEGHQEKKTSVVEEDGRQIEKSIRVFENKEVNQMSSRKENTDGEVGLEWKRFFEDGAFPEKMQDTPQKFHDNKMKKRPKSISIFPMSDEVFRCKMYDEYIDKVLEREERKHQKVIKISSHVDLNKSSGKNSNSSMNPIEKEFIEKAKNRMNRFGINLDDSETEVVEKNTETIVTETETNITKSESHEERVKCLIDGKEIKDARQLPKHLQEFLVLAATDIGDGYGIATGEKTNEADLLHEIDTALKISQGFLLNQGVWSPGSEPPPPPKQPSPERGKNTEKDAGIPPVWTPSSAGASPVAERKEFRPVSFESPILRRKNPESTKNEVPSPPWKSEQGEEKKNETSSDITHNISTRIVNSHSVPSQGLNTLASTPRLPRAQNPTITLLQKAREGQLPKGAAYLNESINSQKSLDSTTISADEIIHTVRREYESKPKIESDSSKKMADQGPRKIEGIGPITKNGMPVSLRSEVKDVNQAKWYKQMYDSLHRSRKNDDYVTIRYKSCRGNRYGHGNSGYLSEPDQPRTCIDKSATLDSRRRQRNKENDSAISTIPRKNTVVKTTAEVYRNQPGRIEDYQPGRSTIGEKETKEPTVTKNKWWDEVMDIFDGPFDQRNPYTAKPYMSHALKESGYESDSTLIFRRRDDVSPLSPLEQRLAYKSVQKGGDVPLHGLRKPAPERPKDDTEIQYFPISSTLTRIRVRRKSALTSTSGSMTSTSMTLTRSKKLTPTASSIIPLSRANIIGTFSHAKTPPSPPRRQSSRFNATLKLYTTTGYPQTSNRRHQQCFAAESVSNIRFLRERLSNKLLKHEQGRECGIARKSLTSLRSTPINSAPSTKVKLSGKAITGVVKRKSDPCLAKRSPECIKSVNTVSRDVPAQRIIQTKQSSEKSSEKFLSRIPESSSVTNRQEVRSKTLPSYQKKDQIKIRKPKKEIEETSKRGSSLDSSSFVQVERLSNNRQADVESTLTGSVIKPSSSSLRRVKSQDIGLSKVISKSREIQKTSRAIRSESPAPVIPKCSTTESNKHKSFAAKLTEKLSINTLSVSTGSNSNNRRKSRDKPQTIVKLSVKKPDIDCKSKEMKTDKKRASVKREKTREVIKMKKNEKSDLEKKKDKKSERMIENSLKKTDKNDQSSTAIDRIKKHQQATRTDNFFQNLFLRNTPSPVLSHCSTPRRSSVMERARMFQELGNAGSKSEPSLRSLSVYLTTKRPVSNSRFKNWEQESFSSRSSSPFRVSWPGRSIFQKITKFDSLQRVSDFGSSSGLSRGRSPDYDNCSIIKERSLSEPPIKVSITDERITRITHLPPRSPSPSPTRSSTSLKTSRSWRNNEEDYYSKARARSVSEVENNERRRITFGSNLSLTKSTSSLESPPTSREEYQRYVLEMLHTKKKSKRYKDLHDFYASLERMGKLEKTTSSSDLRPRMKNEDIIDYNRWREVRNKERAEQELKDLYSKLKTVQREKDFLFSTKDIEMFRWKGDYSLRCKERSVENIRETFRRLENEKNEVESTRRHEIASQKDIYKPLWRGNSVVNVASTIMKKANESKQDEHDKWSTEPYLQKTLGGSKKFWSSLSVEQVNALKNQLNEIYGSENERPKVPAKSPNITEKIAVSETPTKFTSKIKNTDSKTEYEVIVPPSEFGDSLDEVKGLSVRCHSMLVPDIKSSGKPSTVLKRSDSISNGRCHGSSNSMTEVEKKRLSLTLGKEILNKVSQKKSSRSPVAPRETLGAIAAASAKKKNIPQTLSTINTSPRTCYSLETSLDEDTSKSRDRSDFLLVLTPNGDSPVSRKKVENVLEEWAKKPPLLALSVPNTQIKNTSGSELDSTTESSENSVKTVVQREDKADVVPRKVEFFENIKREKETNEQSLVHFAGMKKRKSKLSSSQSFADLKELFGESESARYVSSPFHPSEPGSCIHVKSSESETSDKGKRGSTSISPDVPSGRLSSDSHSHDLEHHRPRSVSPCRVSTSTCSLESLRYRSISPDPEHYWRAYLQLVKHGAVKKLRAKFESLEELSGERVKFALTPKRFQSDPELTRNLLKRVSDEKKTLKRVEVPDVAWLRRKYEPIRRRSKRRLTRSPIPRIPLRLEDLTMPHINVISKTAELKDNAMSRSSSSNSLAIKAETEELEASRPVGRLREKFEKMETNKPSILGEMFTSAPDVYELRDISPYLTGHWVAHKYPSRRDNARSLSLPPDLESSSNRKSQTVKTHSGRTTLPRDEKSKGLRPVSASPVRSRTPTSILKQRQTDPFANQPFDPSKHRPKYRYQPPPTPPPPAPLIRRATRPWWPPLPTYIAKPTVTFEEYSNAPPPPPPKSQHCRSDYQESPRRYVEGEVTIHYRSPVRTEAKEILSEEELARRSAENMRRVYQEERRRKYLQELHDIDSRRHTDNFIPSQKSPIPLNRYDDFVDDLSYRSRSQEQTPEPRLVARALYNFVGQTSRELSFRRGDIILIRRQIDKNWYEGEHNAMVGLFPLNHVEILPYDGARTTPKKPYEGQARAKFNFIAQTNLELSLAKGELVVLTRRVDENWYEGRIGNKKGIFPVSYVEVIMEPGQHRPETPVSSKPVASPAAHSMLSNGTASGKMSMGPHHYTPSIPVKTSTTEPQYISLPRIGVTERNKLHVAPVNETLHIDTHSDTIPYRALYNYRPQNEDELELKEGDTVYVIEKCDDGWFVGSSQRTGYFGTFPGNYVERL